MRILASPARRNRERNPFNFLLSEALAARGCEVVDLDGSNGFAGGWDVFHIHWPQDAARGRRRIVVWKCIRLLLTLSAQRLRGASVVWTVHNVRGHETTNPGLERWLMTAVGRLVSGVIFLNDSSRLDAYAATPEIANEPYAVIPHGLYGYRSQKSRDEAREQFGLPLGGRVIGFLGDIKRYKGVDRLLAAFEEMLPGEATLFIAGAFTEPAYRATTHQKLVALDVRGHSIVFHEDRLDNEKLADAARACDLVVLPYRVVWNSGLALVALENAVPILVSAGRMLTELQSEVGADWAYGFEGDLNGEALRSALDRASSSHETESPTLSDARQWDEVAAATIAFYRRLRTAAHSGDSANAQLNEPTRVVPLVATAKADPHPIRGNGRAIDLDLPLVSVIVPAFQHRAELIECLKALCEQDYAGEYEVIVVNNGARGELDDLAPEFPRAVFIDEPTPGSYRARNTGLARARGTVLAFTDADCRPLRTWLTEGVKAALAHPECGLVGGRIDVFPQSPSAVSVAELFDLKFGFPQRHYVERRGYSVTANMFTTREVIAAVGPFRADLRSGGDAEWGQRVYRAGCRLIYNDSAAVLHPARDRDELIRKLRRTAAGARDRHPDWRACLVWCTRRLIPPRHRIRSVLTDKKHRLTAYQKLLLVWLVTAVEWRSAFERFRLQVLGGQSPRS